MRSGREQTNPVRSPGVMLRTALSVRHQRSVSLIDALASPSAKRISRIGAWARVRHALVAVVMAVAALCWGNRAHAQGEVSPRQIFIPSVYGQATPLSSLSPQSVIRTSSPADTVHFCLPADPDDWEGDVGISAAKQRGDLNVGEPRTVRMIYFLPNDRSFRADVVQKIKDEIRNAQAFYAEEMQSRGYGDKTFRFETDAQGAPLIHRVDGQHPDSYYLYNTSSTVYDEIGSAFDFYSNVYVIVIDNNKNLIGSGSQFFGGVGVRRGKNGGTALIPHGFSFGVLAHELGHAFGLQHDFHSKSYIMSYGGAARSRLAACSAGFLAVHPYFNADSSIDKEPGPSIELVSSPTYPPGSESVPVHLEVSDPEGLHQSILFVRSRFSAGPVEVKGCHGLAGVQNDVVEFDYDGAIPSNDGTSLSDSPLHSMYVRVTDTDGNSGTASVVLWEISPNRIATLEGHTQAVSSVSFSPDGTILASASHDHTIRLWDMSTEKNIAILEGHKGPVGSVSFSPDGTILASAGSYRRDGTIRLWDVQTEENIAILAGHEGPVNSVSFSPDGTILASASGRPDGTIRLWDVQTEENIAILVGHNRENVNSVSFSPDGTILASGSEDRTVKIWDVETKENTATFGHATGISTVSFSPGASTLASGPVDHTIRLWDIVTESNIATLQGHTSFVRGVSFSPDGIILASGSEDRTIRIWDVETKENIATFTGHAAGISTVSFSPDGTILASGARDNAVNLWNVFEWASVVPDMPANLQAIPDIAQALLSWEAPADDRGSEIIGYAYRHKENGGSFSQWGAIPDSRSGEANAGSYTVTGLTNGSTYTFDVRAVNIHGGGRSASVTVTLPPGPTSTESEELPAAVALLGNYPNPFNPETTIGYALPHTGKVRLVVYDLLGHEVAVLVDGLQPAGRHAVRFRGDHLPSGPYAYRLQAGDEVVVRTMILVK